MQQFLKSQQGGPRFYHPSDSLSLDDNELGEEDDFPTASLEDNELCGAGDFPTASTVEAVLKAMIGDNDVDTPTTFADLLSGLSVEMNDQGRVIMSMRDWSTFHNSLIVNSMFFSNVMRQE